MAPPNIIVPFRATCSVNGNGFFETCVSQRTWLVSQGQQWCFMLWSEANPKALRIWKMTRPGLRNYCCTVHIMYISQNLTDSTSRSLSSLSSTYHPFISPLDWQFCSASLVARGPRRPFYPTHYVPPVVRLLSIWSIWRWKGLKASIQDEPRLLMHWGWWGWGWWWWWWWWWRSIKSRPHTRLLWSFRHLCHSFNLDGCLDGLKLPKSIIARYHCFILGQKDIVAWFNSVSSASEPSIDINNPSLSLTWLVQWFSYPFHVVPTAVPGSDAAV